MVNREEKWREGDGDGDDDCIILEEEQGPAVLAQHLDNVVEAIKTACD